MDIRTPLNIGRNQTLYHICVYGSIGLFLLHTIYTYLLFFYIADHDYSIISEIVAVVLVVVLAFGCFVALATLYTVTLNEQAYHHIRPVCLSIAGVYLTTLTVAAFWVLIQSLTDEQHQKLLKLLGLPLLIEFAAYLTVAYTFYNLHSVAGYIMIPSNSIFKPVYQYRY